MDKFFSYVLTVGAAFTSRRGRGIPVPVPVPVTGGPRPGPRPRIAAARTKPCGPNSRSGSRATTGGTAGVGCNR
eukprot:7388411-Prymnesium_polylepis.3